MIRHGLRTRLFGGKIYCFRSIDSTSSCARAIASCGAAEGTVVYAEEQTEGRGRHGRTWLASPGKNLMFSVILRPAVSPQTMTLFPLYAAVAVAEGIGESTGLAVGCKWPNDLLIAGKKTAGILLEGALNPESIEYVIVGIGINVNQRTFPPDLAQKATSLSLASRREHDRRDVLQAVLRTLETRYKELTVSGPGSLLSSWLEKSPMLNRPVSVLHEGQTVTGIMKGLSPQGGMILSVDGSDRVLHAGDATILQVA